MSFPIEQWFDLGAPISKRDVEMAEAQMALYAVKDGLSANGAEVREACRDLRQAVKAHNRALRS